MCQAIYIIAYHGTDPETRQIRSDNHNKQIEWWLDYDSEIEIRILAQDFVESEYWDNPRVQYIDRLDSPVPPATARNILLNHFYDTNEQWAVFGDSDAILNLHPNFPHTHINIVDVLRNHPEAFEDVDLFCPHNDQRPGDGAFYDKFNCVDPNYRRNKNFTENVDWDNELVFDRKLTHMKGTLFFLKNNPERLLMDEGFNNHPTGTKAFIPGEDDEFMIRFVLNNKGTYMLRNIMLKEFTAGSTWSDQSTRKAEDVIRDSYILQKYTSQLQNGNFNTPDRSKWTSFVKKNNTGYPPQLRINPKKSQNNSLFSF